MSPFVAQVGDTRGAPADPVLRVGYRCSAVVSQRSRRGAPCNAVCHTYTADHRGRSRPRVAPAAVTRVERAATRPATPIGPGLAPSITAAKARQTTRKTIAINQRGARPGAVTLGIWTPVRSRPFARREEPAAVGSLRCLIRSPSSSVTARSVHRGRPSRAPDTHHRFDRSWR